MDTIPIYNYVASDENPITWGTFNDIIVKGTKYPPMQLIWKVYFTLNKYILLHWLHVLFLHWTLAIVVDTAAVLCGKKPQLVFFT